MPPAGVVPATLGNPGAMRVGSEAYVVGNPYGLYGSLSSGVVSGLHRSYHLPDSGRVISGLIQVDAAVNPGNSGGPLLDRSGRVVGIVTALVNPTKQDVFIGIGFAVPIDVAGGAAGLPSY
jgi:S1-C subfamily serine protease